MRRCPKHIQNTQPTEKSKEDLTNAPVLGSHYAIKAESCVTGSTESSKRDGDGGQFDGVGDLPESRDKEEEGRDEEEDSLLDLPLMVFFADFFDALHTCNGVRDHKD